ncbi:MAG TPA: hypothetical protein VL053_17210, partial [Arachidicoccus sp.]|nr:hypothetical protein [Arachidicoccus sp.]
YEKKYPKRSDFDHFGYLFIRVLPGQHPSECLVNINRNGWSPRVGLYTFDDKFIEKLIDRMDQNQDIYEKILEDKSFGDLVRELIMKRIYNQLNKS